MGYVMLVLSYLKLSLLNWRRSVKSKSIVSPELPDLDRLRGGILPFALAVVMVGPAKSTSP